jgi:3-oxoacyl-[acyl-carrier protein] reductase
MSTGRFHNQTVLITGASRGIGAAIAKAFAAEGACVLVNYLSNENAANGVISECEKLGGTALLLQADVRDPSAAQDMVAQAMREVGRIDILVNNAFSPYAFDPENRKRFWETPWIDYQTQFDGAVRANYNVCQSVIPNMRQRAKGSIINMVSDLVYRPSIPYNDYTTAKSALVGFSRNLAAELGSCGIRVNCVAPGLVSPTASSAYTKESMKDRLIAQTPLGRLATPADVAGPVLFLASDDSQFMTGQVLVVDGGLVMT